MRSKTWRYDLGSNISHAIDRGLYKHGKNIETAAKTIARVDRFMGFSSTPHIPSFKHGCFAVGPDGQRSNQIAPGQVTPQVDSSVFILHTLLFSLEEWVQKRQRGYADRVGIAGQCHTCRKN